MLETNVFNRKLEEGVSGNLIDSFWYNLIFGAVLAWGFAVNWLLLILFPNNGIGAIVFILYILLCIAGFNLFKKSANPVLSFLGYNLVVLPLGMVINFFVSLFAPSRVIDIVRATGLVTMMILALNALFPRFFEKESRLRYIALGLGIVIEVCEVFILHYHQNLIVGIVTIAFCSYIGYDWERANKIPKTVDNAIDGATAIYMDAINLLVIVISFIASQRSNRRRSFWH